MKIPSSVKSILGVPFFGKRAEDGTAIMEFGLLMPVYMLIAYAVFEFARVLFIQANLFYAAEEATRYAAVNYDADSTEIEQVVQSKFMLIDPDKISLFNIEADINPVDQTRLVTVEIGYDFEPIFPIGWGTIGLFGHSRGFIVID